MRNLQYKNIVKCIGNYNDYNVIYCKFPQIFPIFAQPFNQTQQITIQCHSTH